MWRMCKLLTIPIKSLPSCSNQHHHCCCHHHHIMHFSSQLTFSSVTDHSSIIAMTTITYSAVKAVYQVCLCAIAGHIVIVDCTSACTKVSWSIGRYHGAVTELSAYYNSIKDVPRAIAYCAPKVVEVDLNSSFISSGASYQTNTTITCNYSTEIKYKRLNSI